MDILFRKMTEKDLPLILTINRNFREGFAKEDAARRFVQNPANWLFAALLEQEIIGFAYGYSLQRLDGQKNMLYVHEVGIMREHQRKGVGFQMLTALKRACAEANIGKIFLMTARSNEAANALYRKLGGEVSIESGGADVAYFFPIPPA